MERLPYSLLEKDINFLAKRVLDTAWLTCDSLVAIAYGVQKLEDQILSSYPFEIDDCEKVWEQLPKHRKKGDALTAMDRLRKCLKPKDENY